MNNFIIDTPDNFWQIRWLDKYMEGHKGFIAGGCFKNILSGEKVKDIDIFFESEDDFQEAVDLFNDEKHQKEGWKFKYRNEKVCAFHKEGERVWIEFIESEFGKPEEILRSFDFTVAKMAYYKEPKYEEEEDDYFLLNRYIMSTSKEYKAVRNYILNELHLTKEDIIKNIELLLEKHVKRYMVNTYGGDNQIENWIRCMVNDELKQRDHDFVRRACESVIRDHVLNELNIIVRSKSEKCTCENRVPSEEDKKESTDGLYIIYKDGHAEPFTGDNSKDCVRYIGLKHRYMSFAISLTEHDIVQLLDDDSREESGSGTYYERECDALFDIDGRGNTERLVARNPKLRNLLEDGEYIPSLGQLNLMAHYMDELNKAFTYVSASPLSSTWYWSSTESSQAVAWYVVFSSGLTGTGNKHIGDMVRTVIDF